MVFDINMEENLTDEHAHRIGAMALCLLISLIFHLLLAIFLVITTTHTPKKAQPAQHKGNRAILVTRTTEKKKKANTSEPKQQTETPKPFAKTDADRPQQRPERADFEGQRDARAEGMNNRARKDDKPLPTMEGEDKKEVNTLQQERQDGDVEYYGKKDTVPTPQPMPQPQQQTNTPLTPQPAKGIPEAPLTTETDTGKNILPTEQEATEARAPIHKTDDGDLKIKHPDKEQKPTATHAEPPAPPIGHAKGQGKERVPTQPSKPAQIRRPVYDPTQADHAQPPGLRTTERRTRSTGQFVIGRLPSCNVEATPRGQYEELVYRLIARQWYFACDQHRGDIIPGTIIIALRINTRGRVESMNLVNRRGASVSQQSFTFKAIRRAQFPAMPKAVVKTLIGDRMELIITFDFN